MASPAISTRPLPASTSQEGLDRQQLASSQVESGTAQDGRSVTSSSTPRSFLSAIKGGDIFFSQNSTADSGRALNSKKVGLFSVALAISAALFVYGAVALCLGAGPAGLIPIAASLVIMAVVLLPLYLCRTAPTVNPEPEPMLHSYQALGDDMITEPALRQHHSSAEDVGVNPQSYMIRPEDGALDRSQQSPAVDIVV